MSNPVSEEPKAGLTLIVAGAVALVVAIWVGVHQQTRKIAFMQTPSGSYQVLAAKNIHGTNLHFSADSPFEISLRRNLDRLGVHLKGDRGKPGFAEDIGIHAIALRYQDRVPAGDLSQVLFECVTESGQTVRLNHRIIMQGSRGRTCLIFFYADSAIPDLYRLGFCESEVTNFCPVQLRLLRKSDHFELSRLDLEH